MQHTLFSNFKFNLKYLFRCVHMSRDGKWIFITRFDSSGLCTSSAKVAFRAKPGCSLVLGKSYGNRLDEETKPVEWSPTFFYNFIFPLSSAVGVNGDQFDMGNGGCSCYLENVRLYDHTAYKQWRQLFCRFAMTDWCCDLWSVILEKTSLPHRQIQTQSVRSMRWTKTAVVVPTEMVFHFFVINPAVRTATELRPSYITRAFRRRERKWENHAPKSLVLHSADDGGIPVAEISSRYDTSDVYTK